jgi:hypothetical protein
MDLQEILYLESILRLSDKFNFGPYIHNSPYFTWSLNQTYQNSQSQQAI